MAAHDTADYSDEHADTLTRKDLYKYFRSQDNVWASENVNKKKKFSSSFNWENFGNLRQILSYIIFLSVWFMVISLAPNDLSDPLILTAQSLLTWYHKVLNHFHWEGGSWRQQRGYKNL